MSIPTTTPWHKASYERFLHDRLPGLLAERLPLAGYRALPNGPHTCTVSIELSNGVSVSYSVLPYPDENGLFDLNGCPCLVVPQAAHEALDTAEILCVGELLSDHIQECLGQASDGLQWDAELLQAWLPLDRWVREFFLANAQYLDETNWLSRHTHLRRLILRTAKSVINPGQFGRVCPFETPETVYMGRIFTVAIGAEIRDERLVVLDDGPSYGGPQAGLGLSAAMLPFLENNDPNRLLMAANFQRQALPAPDPEPALVQTGYEPDEPGFWCGRNLLTAYMSLGEATMEDAIVLSESAARRLSFPRPLEVGDRLSNRHGLKGVVSQILSEEAMPCLPDGAPVELVFSAFGLPRRLIPGAAREALLGRIAHHEGRTAFAPPFASPGQAELRLRLEQCGLPASGQEQLTLDGRPCEMPVTVGWVYWNRSVYLAADKLVASAGESLEQTFGELEFQALQAAGACESIRDAFHTRSARRADAAALLEQVADEAVEPPDEPAPWLQELSRRLDAAGIRASLEGKKLSFAFLPTGVTGAAPHLKLARSLPHPWLREHLSEEVGAWIDEVLPESEQARRASKAYTTLHRYDIRPGEAYLALQEANTRLERMLASRVPERLLQAAEAQLAARLQAYCEALLPPQALSLGEPLAEPGEPGYGESQLFSAAAIITPASDLGLDQVGLADGIAWELFGAQAARRLGDAAAVQARTPAAGRMLDEIMASAWVILQRTPVMSPSALLAFQPVRKPDRTIRLHPLACEMLNADFDGDRLAVFLPLSAAARREAAEKLSVQAHLQRDPALAGRLLPAHPEVMWGLAWLNLDPRRRPELAALLNIEPAALPELLTQEALARFVEALFERLEPAAILERLQSLMQLGCQVVRSSGASFSPFIASNLHLPPAPESSDPAQWQVYTEEMSEALLSGKDYSDPTLGPQLLLAQIRQRNRFGLPFLLIPHGPISDAGEQPFLMRHTLVDGLSPQEMYAQLAGARRAFAEILVKGAHLSQSESARSQSTGMGVLSRARRSPYPGIVFARAAASGEVDSLDDPWMRCLLGV